MFADVSIFQQRIFKNENETRRPSRMPMWQIHWTRRAAAGTHASMLRTTSTSDPAHHALLHQQLFSSFLKVLSGTRAGNNLINRHRREVVYLQ